MKTKPVLLALIVALALGVGIYAMNAPSGNIDVALASTENRETACALSYERGKKLDPKAVGEVAAIPCIERAA